MRVIAGKARRTQLTAPAGLNTRPTSDMCRENLFNILSPYITGARFLDLFCGSGAIGIEALSRGATISVFVDNAHIAKEATFDNLQRTKLLEQSEFFRMTATNAIVTLTQEERQFDIIFLDPPYEDIIMLNKTIYKIFNTSILAPNGIVIVETDLKNYTQGNIVFANALEFINTRKYGNTCFIFLKDKVGNI